MNATTTSDTTLSEDDLATLAWLVRREGFAAVLRGLDHVLGQHPSTESTVMLSLRLAYVSASAEVVDRQARGVKAS